MSVLFVSALIEFREVKLRGGSLLLNNETSDRHKCQIKILKIIKVVGKEIVLFSVNSTPPTVSHI